MRIYCVQLKQNENNKIPVVTGKGEIIPASASEKEQHDELEPENILSDKALNLSDDSVKLVKDSQKVSTAVGQSPPRDIKSEENNNETLKQPEDDLKTQDNPPKVVTMSTGTSPPPQTISTQVSLK